MTEILATKAAELQSKNPVLWAILRGRGSAKRISYLIGWPEDKVRAELKDMKAKGLVYHHIDTWLLDHSHSAYLALSKIKEYLLLFEETQVREALERGETIDEQVLSSAVRNKLSKDLADSRRSKRRQVLTLVQQSTLETIYKNFKGNPFRTIELARALGYTTSGWTKGYVEGLVKKGRVVKLSHDPKLGVTWQLTQLGVDEGKRSVQ